jgi:hypothetical protein
MLYGTAVVGLGTEATTARICNTSAGGRHLRQDTGDMLVPAHSTHTATATSVLTRPPVACTHVPHLPDQGCTEVRHPQQHMTTMRINRMTHATNISRHSRVASSARI